MSLVDHAIWWQVYPLGATGAPIRGGADAAARAGSGGGGESAGALGREAAGGLLDGARGFPGRRLQVREVPRRAPQ